MHACEATLVSSRLLCAVHMRASCSTIGAGLFRLDPRRVAAPCPLAVIRCVVRVTVRT